MCVFAKHTKVPIYTPSGGNTVQLREKNKIKLKPGWRWVAGVVVGWFDGYIYMLKST